MNIIKFKLCLIHLQLSQQLLLPCCPALMIVFLFYSCSVLFCFVACIRCYVHTFRSTRTGKVRRNFETNCRETKALHYGHQSRRHNVTDLSRSLPLSASHHCEQPARKLYRVACRETKAGTERIDDCGRDSNWRPNERCNSNKHRRRS